MTIIKIKLSLFLVSVITFAFVSNGFAFNQSRSSLEGSSFNPFTPQLPEIKKPKPVKPKKSERKISRTPTSKKKPVQRPSFDKSKTTKTPVVKKIVESPPVMVISGIIWDTDRPQAIINDQVVDVGDKIELYKIVSIKKSGIEVSRNGKITKMAP